MFQFSAQDCPPIYLVGGTTAFGIATGCALAASPLICTEQRLCLLPYLARPRASVSLLDKKKDSNGSRVGAKNEANTENVIDDVAHSTGARVPLSEVDRLLPGDGIVLSTNGSTKASGARASTSACLLSDPAQTLAEYRTILARAWSGAPELANIYPSSGFYGNLQPSVAELTARLDRLQLVKPSASGFLNSLSQTLVAGTTTPTVRPLIFLSLCADEMQSIVEQCNPEALKCAGGDAGVVAARVAADQVAALLEQVEQYHSSLSHARVTTVAPTTVVVIADDLCRAGLMRYASDLEARAARVQVLLLYTWVHELSPPALDSGLTEASVRCAASGTENGLVSLCTSVTLGLERTLDVTRSDPVPFVPVDVAANVALMEVLLGRCASTASSTLAEARTLGEARVAAISVGALAASPMLVWGMFAEYLLDYVSRYASRIRAVFPVASGVDTPQSPPSEAAGATVSTSSGLPVTAAPTNRTGEISVPLLDPCPTLQFSPSRANCFHGRYGVGMTSPVPCVLSRQANQRAVALLSTTSYLIAPQRAILCRVRDRAQQLRTRVMAAREAVEKAVASDAAQRGLSTPALIATAALVPGGTLLVAAQLAKNRATVRGRSPKKGASSARAAAATSAASSPSLYAFTTTRYAQRCARLAQTPALAAYLQFVSLGDVDWGMYVRLLARAALFHLARFVVGVAESDKLPFPAPTRLFVNDITFHGPDLAPPEPVCHRRLLHAADWFARVGITASGTLNTMTPGMSSRRLAAILEQPGVRALLSTVAANEGVPVDEVESRAKKILLRLGDTQAQLPSRTAGLLVRQLFFKVYDRVNVTRNGYAFLRRLYSRPRTHVVLVPLHRSYADFLVMTYLHACAALPTPHIVAGEDFLGMGKFAALLRGSGAFFMRRSFKGDPLYGRLFREYVRQLVYHGQPIEFFIEGTRSRTNKTMVPKLGILKFIADALYEGAAADIDDVLIVPVSLSYDELLEAGVYAKELLGIPKPRESVPNMIRAGLSLDRLYGSINIAFGDPISLCAFRENPTQCPPGFRPKTTSGAVRPSSAPSKPTATAAASAAALMTANAVSKPSYSTPAPLVTALGWRIAYELQRNIVVTPSALVAAVFECFGACPTASTPSATRMPSMPMSRMVELVAWLREHLLSRHAHLSRELAMWTPMKVTQGGLERLVRFVATRTESTPPATNPGTSATPATAMASTTTTATSHKTVVYDPPTITSRLGVNMSANQLIHLFIDEAVISLIAAVDGAAVPGRDDRLVPTVELEKQARFLTAVLSHEFPNFASASPCSFESWLNFAVGRVQQFGHLEVGVTAVTTPSPSSDRAVGSPAREAPASLATTPIPAARLSQFHLLLILPHIEAAFYVASALQILLASGGSGVQNGVATASGQSAGIPVKAFIQAVHHAAMELCGEEVSTRRSAPPTRSHSADTEAPTAATAAAPLEVLQYTSTTCNKEVLSHYAASVVDTGAVSLHAAPTVPGGQVYRVKDAVVLQKVVADLGRYVTGCVSVQQTVGSRVSVHGEATAKAMKSALWKHYNKIAAPPKL